MSEMKTPGARTLTLTDGTVVLVAPLPPEACAVYGMGGIGLAVLVTLLAARVEEGDLRTMGGRRGRPSVTTYVGHMQGEDLTARAGWDAVPESARVELVAAVNGMEF